MLSFYIDYDLIINKTTLYSCSASKSKNVKL